MDKENIKEKPRVTFKSLSFNDGSSLSLTPNSIVVFTGANNCGKSQVLRDLERAVYSGNEEGYIVLSNYQLNYYGSIENQTYLDAFYSKNNKGDYHLLDFGSTFPLKNLIEYWQGHNLHNGLSGTFVKRLATENRIILSNALNRHSQPEKSPIYKLNKSDELASQISGYFRQAFGVDLIVNRNEMQTIPLHVGNAPDKKAYTMEKHDEYYKIIAELPKLQE